MQSKDWVCKHVNAIKQDIQEVFEKHEADMEKDGAQTGDAFAAITTATYEILADQLVHMLEPLNDPVAIRKAVPQTISQTVFFIQGLMLKQLPKLPEDFGSSSN